MKKVFILDYFWLQKSCKKS